ncbi:MAG TPA: hypothetical protein VHB99_08865 [Pirellulales bacterium]|nr:hypothetical protein [Pirellulales bacterium]
MSRRFQFSLSRLLVSLSVVCAGAAIFAAARVSEDALFVFCALVLDVLIVGAAIGLLVGERPARGAFRGVCYALCFLVIVLPVAFLVGAYYGGQAIVGAYMEAADRADKEEAALFRVPPTTKADDSPEATPKKDD